MYAIRSYYEFKGNADYKMIIQLAQGAKGPDVNGYRTEFISMVKTAELLGK